MRLGLEAGAQFVVVGEGDVVVLKALKPPKMANDQEEGGWRTKRTRLATRVAQDPIPTASAANPGQAALDRRRPSSLA